MAEQKLIPMDKVRELVGGHDYEKSFNFDFSDRGVQIAYEDENWTFSRNKKEFRVSPIAINSLIGTVELPTAFRKFASSYPDLLAHNINYLLKRKSGASKALRIKNRIVAFAPPDATIIKNDTIVDTIEKSFGSEAKIDKCSVRPDGTTDINVVSSDGDKLQVGQGDMFNSGVHIQNHPYGVSRPQVDGYLLRLVCLNGAIGMDEVFRAPTIIGEDPKNWLRASITKARKTTTQLFESIKALSNREIEGNVQDLLEGLYVELALPSKVQDLINRRVGREGAESMYDIFNHFTHVASNVGVVRRDPILRNRLMRASSHYASHVAEVCNNCNRPRLSLN